MPPDYPQWPLSACHHSLGNSCHL
uniref:Uncharacterized protein n=1 Tax=Anguilla anguilla TaxID=7936 RepID=A0A0E9W1M3_ANGAN